MELELELDLDLEADLNAQDDDGLGRPWGSKALSLVRR